MRRHLERFLQEALEELRRSKLDDTRESSEQLAAQETAHMKAAEELEHEYERKLAAEAARWEALRKDKEDVQCQLEERIYSLAVAGQDKEVRLRQERDDLAETAQEREAEAESVQVEMQRKYEEMLSQVCAAAIPH